MTTHTISPKNKIGNETLCGIEFHPLRFISYIIFDKFHTVEDPCFKCLKLLNEMKRSIILK